MSKKRQSLKKSKQRKKVNKKAKKKKETKKKKGGIEKAEKGLTLETREEQTITKKRSTRLSRIRPRTKGK